MEKWIRPGSCLQEPDTLPRDRWDTHMNVYNVRQREIGSWKEGPSNLGIQRESRFQWGWPGNVFSTEEETSELGMKPRVRLQKAQMGGWGTAADGMAWARTEVEKRREQTVIDQISWHGSLYWKFPESSCPLSTRISIKFLTSQIFFLLSRFPKHEKLWWAFLM